MQQPLLERTERTSPGRAARLLFSFGAVSLGSSLQFGFAIGVLNNLDELVPQSLAGSGGVSLVQWSLVVSGFPLGGLIGSVLGTKLLSQYFARKTALLFINLFVLASSLLFAFGGRWYILVAARIFIGIVAGAGTKIVPMYFAEISPTKLIKSVGAVYQMGISCGILLAQVCPPTVLDVYI